MTHPTGITGLTIHAISLQLHEIVCEQGELPRNTVFLAESAFDADLGMDSLAVVETVLATEEVLGVKLSVAHPRQVPTWGTLLDLVIEALRTQDRLASEEE